MSAVVIRCPNCGTTQAATGECEACHSADVRWFCPNHTPGRWLDGPACDACGARVGVDPVPARAPRRPTPRPASAPVEWAPPPTPRRPSFPPEEARPPAVPEVEWVRVDPADAARVVARGAFGCVGRLVMLVVVLFVLALLAVGGFLGGVVGFAPG